MSHDADREQERAPEQPSDRCSGLLVTAIGAAAVVLALGLPVGSVARPAAGTFPLLLGTLLTGLGLVLTVQQIRLGLSFAILRHLGRRYGADLILFAVLITAYFFAFEPVGFVVTTAALLSVMLWFYQSVPLWRSIVCAVLLTGVAYVLFNVAFRVRLPDGIFPYW